MEAAGVVGASSFQVAILAACAVSAAALAPGLLIGGLQRFESEKARYPRGRFIARFVGIVFLWNLATGAFNPFYNVYAAQFLGMSVTATGDLFATGQFAQVSAILAAPILLRRLGRVRAIAGLQMAAGACLLVMALGGPLWLPAVGYLLYMSFQWMSEPGLHSLLMGQVGAEERAGASSLNYAAVFAAQAIAAGAAGAALERWGYPGVLAAAGGIALAAGWLFRASLAALVTPADTR
jgi:predicted MFS family arabinose efflux permease